MERRSPGVQVNQTIIEEAIDQVLAGNREAYRTIIQAYERKIYTYCYYILRSHEEAEDAVQDIFVKVYQELRRYEKRVSFSAWLYKVAYHHCLDQVRKRKRRNRLLSLYKEQQPKAYYNPNDEEPLQKLFMDDLTAEESNLLILKVVEQYSFEEMGQIMDCNSATLRKKFERLRKKLVRQRMNEGGSPHGEMARSN
ncbi:MULTISPECIES: RNA polymerase sigma factor [Paenibacillus]|uniref:RNA polymerase subunit sigma n=2 Tax=Paenibacillus TaxID=44249 RepID=A0A1R0WWV0_9BACL|nr:MULTISPECIES: RNA polymerase sigma factor [Paenibacillus]AWV31732.1 RNA polymerase subunit sigma [Paenibacillus odorifer]MDH6430648.1 RNA polymerase sigma factor (sigma-70 family) [Paenibacillus sp. PastH-4]MDH6446657.1 RNA polymerase sigma factor (sigma-70 family) [Paenibacillus sp. PastF-4]MDH6530885.1 RNA polymerase sigma factor (sigma-70 family) [Paenibacillus sp. PastH-3]MEC0133131.1 RNA polymerase sigma factor [Paenibacillus odorifer]